MMWIQSRGWAFGLAVLGLAVVGGTLASENGQAQSGGIEPGVKQGPPRLKGSQPVPAKDGQDAEVEAHKKEIEALRKKVEALGKKGEQPHQEHPKIVVSRPMTKDVVVSQQYACKIHAHRHINLRALASGFVTEVAVKEGQAVKRGDVMFKVLPALYQAKLDVELAEVQLAQLDFNNTNKLFKDKVVSPNEVALAQAKLAKAQAKAKLAAVELSFTTVQAPFDGMVGRIEEQLGSLVNERDILTTLSDNSVVWVYFNVPQARYLETMGNRDKEAWQVQLVLANGSKFPHAGKIGAIEAKFNNETGDIPFRADFPNPDRLLRHGQTGNILIQRTVKNAIVIPQGATFEILDRRYVYVVGKDDVVHQREIVIQHEMDGVHVIKEGLDGNDRIVLEGARQIRDGEKVEYTFRKPEDVMANPKKAGEK